MFGNIRYDIKAIKERDPAARSGLEVFLLYSGFHAVLYYRVANFFYRHKLKFIARWISQTGRFFTGVEIHPGATIGKGLMIDHGMGVVIGETAIIGDNCTIYQGVTLGGTGKDTGKRHPTIGNNVMIGSGAKVLGPFTVGDNAKIAAGAVVLDTVPEGATAVGVPARMILQGKKKTDAPCKNDLDQIHIPDPVSQELCKMYMRIEALEKQLAEKNKNENNSTTESDNK
ncbi:MAG: serine O-acetyltransferase [Clostridia bacterium]|nr:serine O-acetyltransferase [Clostridia bacterium]